MNAKRRDSSRRGGFSLIELLLVMVILVVLAAVVVPKFTGRSEQAREAAAKADIARLGLQLDAFEIDTGRFPNNSEGLSALVNAPGNVQNWRGSYLKRGVPNDPWGRPYQYLNPGVKGEIDVMSYGADGQPGGEGKNADVGSWQ